MGRRYRGHYLTEEKKQFAQDNCRLAYKFVNELVSSGKIHSSERDEVLGYVFWQLCTCVEKYDISKVNENGYNSKFSTMAYSGFRNGFSRYIELKKRFRERFVLVDFCSSDDDKGNLEWKDPGEDKKTVKMDDLRFIFEECELEAPERQIIFLYTEQGFSFVDIGEMLLLTHERIRQIYTSVIKKANKYVKKEGFRLNDFYSRGDFL